MKSLLPLALLLGAAPPVVDPSPFFIDLELIYRIECGMTFGTGVAIGPNTVLTADHVVAHKTCSIDGKPIKILQEDGYQDFAIVGAELGNKAEQAISCDGYKAGRTYFATGYAHGRFAVQRLTGTGKLTKDPEFPKQAVLRGMIFSGMSGGPIVDEAGQMVGIVNASDEEGVGLSRPLDQTFLCKA